MNREGKKISQLLKMMRQERGLSQSAVAKGLSVPVRTYQSWEAAYTSNIDNLIAICTFYDITPVELFSGWQNERRSDRVVKKENPFGREMEILNFLMEGGSLDVMIDRYPDIFQSSDENAEDILYRLILDIYFTHPDVLKAVFPGFCREKEQMISERYHIPAEAVTVVCTEKIQYQLLKEILLSFPGAGTLTEWVADKPGFRLGISNGYTVARIFDQLERSKVRNLNLFPLNFSNTQVDFPISSNSLISSFLYKTEGYGNVMDTPGEMEIYGSMLLADAVILGVGTFQKEGLYETMIRSSLGSSRMDLIHKAGAVGDLNYNLLDSEGNQIDIPEIISPMGHPENSSLIKAINLDLLSQKADRGCRVMVAAAGDHKALPVHLSLKKGYANHLLIDYSLAEALLKMGVTGLIIHI